MKHRTLLADIKAAREAISVAEAELEVVRTVAQAPDGAAADVGEIVEVAVSKLKAAKVKLVELKESLSLTKFGAAQVTIDKAEKYFDQVLRELVSVKGADTTYVTKVVADAFAKLRIAKEALAELESTETAEN